MIRLAIVLSLLLLFGTSAVAEKSEEGNASSIRMDPSQCSPTLVSRVGLEQLGEKVVASALMKVTSTDAVIVTVFNSQSGDWTIMIDGENGISCMIMWGSNWLTVNQKDDS